MPASFVPRYRLVTNRPANPVTMATMAAPEQVMRAGLVGVRGPERRLVWALWIIVSVVGAALGAIPAWEIRSRAFVAPILEQQLAVYAATVVSAFITAGAQWLVLRKSRVDAFWWVPATVAANLLAAVIVVPAIVTVALRGVSPINSNTAVIFGTITLATWGLVVGTAQTLVFRKTVGNRAWLWLTATLPGYALAGAVTSALSPAEFDAVIRYGLPIFAIVSLSNAIGALLTSACQAPILARYLFRPR